jgi:hypothetical protein
MFLLQASGSEAKASSSKATSESNEAYVSNAIVHEFR